MDAQIYEVSDLGASFGTAGRLLSHTKSKGNLRSYTRSKFIKKVDPEFVDFNVPRRPSLMVLFLPHEFFSRMGLQVDWARYPPAGRALDRRYAGPAFHGSDP